MLSRYTIHRFLDIIIDSKHQGYHRYFANEFSRISQSSAASVASPLSLTVHITDELPGPVNGEIRRTVRFKNLFDHNFVVRGISGSDVKLYFKHHPFASIYTNAVGVFIQGQVLEPIIYLKLLEQGVILMHCAGVADETGVYLFPARGGTGKTTLALALQQHGFSILGDDLLIVDSATARVFPYPRPLHLFDYNLKSVSGGTVPLRAVAAIKIKNILRVLLQRLTGEPFLISTRVHADEIYRGMEYGKAALCRKVLLLTKQADEAVLSRPDDREAVLEFLISSADLNKSLVANVLQEEAAALNVRGTEKRVLSAFIRHFESFEEFDVHAINRPSLRHFVELLRR